MMKVKALLISILRWISSSAAANLGALFSGVATIFGFPTFRRWQREKQLEENKKVAEVVLNIIDDVQPRFVKWIENRGLVFDPSSNENNGKALDGDRYSLPNYMRDGQEIVELVATAKNHSQRLSDNLLVEKIEHLEEIIKESTSQLPYRYHPNIEGKNRANAYERLSKSPDRVKEKFEEIRAILIEYLKYKKN